MSDGPRLAVIFLDGTDPENIARNIEAGWMPVLAQALRRARLAVFQSLSELFPTALWPCLLRRAGLTARAPSRMDALRRFWRRLPVGLRRVIAKRMPGTFSRAKEAAFFTAFDWTATRAFALPWTYDGYLRINQRGREPFGTVEAGAQRERLLDEIEALLKELRIAGTEKPAVRDIVRTQDLHVGRASAELPDLMVLWNDDAPLPAIESARLGCIENRDIGVRGTHTTRGAIFAWGPAIAPGPALDGARDIDVAPTVLRILGLDPPGELDGRAIADLVRSTH